MKNITLRRYSSLFYLLYHYSFVVELLFPFVDCWSRFKVLFPVAICARALVPLCQFNFALRHKITDTMWFRFQCCGIVSITV